MKKILFGLIASVMVTSLSFGQITSITNKGIISIDFKNKLVKKVTKITESQDIAYTNVSMTFTCDKQMQTFSSEKELIAFISKNPSKASGTFELFLDNSIAYRAQIVNGEKIKEEVFNETTNNKIYPCTLAGIRQCAVDRIHAQNWFDMWTCIAEGIDCVIVKYASCMVDNC